MRKANACLILPTYNEVQNVAAVINSIFSQSEAISTHDLHVLVVDDNSPDGTQDVVRCLMAKYEKLHLITGSKKGLGEAYKRGIHYAIKEFSPDIIFQMDADGQHDPGLIPLFTLLTNHGFSLIIGSRFAQGGGTPNFSFRRKAISLIGNWMIRVLGGVPRIHDCTSGYRCIKVDVLKKCKFGFLSTRGYSFQSSLLCELVRNGAKVIEIPIVFHKRTYGLSKLVLRDQIEFLLNIVKICFWRSEEFLRFIWVGLGGVFVNLACYFLLTRKAEMRLELASPIAIGLSILYNFFFNSHWTSSKRDAHQGTFKKRYSFPVVVVLVALFNYFTLIMLARGFHLSDMLANLLGISIGLVISYSLKSVGTWQGSCQSQDITRSYTHLHNQDFGQIMGCDEEITPVLDKIQNKASAYHRDVAHRPSLGR